MSPAKKDIVMRRVYDLLEMREAERESQHAAELSQLLPVKTEPDAAPTVTAATQSSDSSQPEPMATQPPKKKQKRSLAHRIAGDVTDLTKPTDNLRKEVSDYTNAMVRAGMGPLEWWAKFAPGFQNIAELAREYLSIPPTEVSVSES